MYFLFNLVKLPDNSGALQKLKRNPSDMQEALELKYIERKEITHDTFVFIYEVPENLTLGLNLGQHVAIE